MNVRGVLQSIDDNLESSRIEIRDIGIWQRAVPGHRGTMCAQALSEASLHLAFAQTALSRAILSAAEPDQSDEVKPQDA